MKTQQKNLFSRISKSQVENLKTEAKETLDMGYSNNQSKAFSAADLWNIQRRHLSMNQRRRFAF